MKRPGNGMLSPKIVEGGFRDVIGKTNRILGYGPFAADRLPYDVTALRGLGPNTGRLPLRLIGIVVDDGVPKIEGDRFYFSAQRNISLDLYSFVDGCLILTDNWGN